MARLALIRIADGLVVNVITWESGSNWPLPEGHALRDAGDAGPGDTWDGVRYVRPAPQPSPEPAIIGVLDAIVRSRGLTRLTDAEKAALRKTLG